MRRDCFALDALLTFGFPKERRPKGHYPNGHYHSTLGLHSPIAFLIGTKAHGVPEFFDPVVIEEIGRCVQTLLSHGADPDGTSQIPLRDPTNQGGFGERGDLALLRIAAWRHLARICHLLIKAGARLDAVDDAEPILPELMANPELSPRFSSFQEKRILLRHLSAAPQARSLPNPRI